MAGGARNTKAWNLLPGVLWSAVFLLAALSSGITTAAAWGWGLGTVLLLLVFPWLLVRTLDRAGDLRASIARAPVTPVILGAGALCFMLLRLILWLDGPRVLAAAVFAMLASYGTVLVLGRAVTLDWSAVSTGAAAVVLPASSAHIWGMHGFWGFSAGIALLLLGVARGLLVPACLPRGLLSLVTGALAGGGLFLLLSAL